MNNFEEIMMTRYLLGELSEADQAQMEERYFADRSFFDRLVQLETELLDDHARGRLSGEMRERLERAYLHNPNRRARLKFSKAATARFDEAADAATQTPEFGSGSMRYRDRWLLRGGSTSLRIAMAVALLGFASVSVWLFIVSQRQSKELARSREMQSLQAQQKRETEQQLASERRRAQRLIAELDRRRAETKLLPQSADGVASLLLIAGEARGADRGLPPTLTISRNTTQVRLQLKRTEDEYESYDLGLQTAGGKAVFHRGRLRPETGHSGATFVFTLPVSQVSPGDYILTLRGYLPDGALEDVSQSLFRVEKK